MRNQSQIIAPIKDLKGMLKKTLPASNLVRLALLSMLIGQQSWAAKECSQFQIEPPGAFNNKSLVPSADRLPALNSRPLSQGSVRILSQIESFILDPRATFDMFAFLEASSEKFGRVSERLSLDNLGNIPLLQRYFRQSPDQKDFSGDDALVTLGASLGKLSSKKVVSMGTSLSNPIQFNTIAFLGKIEKLPLVGPRANRRIVAHRMQARSVVRDAVKMLAEEERTLKQVHELLTNFQRQIIEILPELNIEINTLEDVLIGSKQIASTIETSPNLSVTDKRLALHKLNEIGFALDQKIKGLRNVNIALITGLDELAGMDRQIQITAAVHSDARTSVAPIMALRVMSDMAAAAHQRTIAINQTFRSYAQGAMKAAADRAERTTDQIIELATQETFPEELIDDVTTRIQSATQRLQNFISEHYQKSGERRAQRNKISMKLQSLLESRASEMGSLKPEELVHLRKTVDAMENQLKDISIEGPTSQHRLIDGDEIR